MNKVNKVMIDDSKDFPGLSFDLICRTLRDGVEVITNNEIDTLYLDYYLSHNTSGVEILRRYGLNKDLIKPKYLILISSSSTYNNILYNEAIKIGYGECRLDESYLTDLPDNPITMKLL